MRNLYGATVTDQSFVKEIAYRTEVDGVPYEVLACGHRLRLKPGVAGSVPATRRHCVECRKAAEKKKKRA
jgi:hypothetical protein